MAAVQEGRGHELLPFAGQTAGLIHDVVPVAEIVRRLVAEAQQALLETTHALRSGNAAGGRRPA